MPATYADTPDTFSGTVLFWVTKTTRYAARLLPWQWKQWLNRGTDWNNPFCLSFGSPDFLFDKTKSLLMLGFPPCFSLFLSHSFFSSVLSFYLSGWAQVHSSGHWVVAQSKKNVCQQKAVRTATARRRRRRKVGEGAGEGERNDTEGWTESRIRGKVKQAWNRALKTETPGNNTVVNWKVRKKRAGQEVWVHPQEEWRVKEKDRPECWRK